LVFTTLQVDVICRRQDETYSGGGRGHAGGLSEGECPNEKWRTVLYTSVVAGDVGLGLVFRIIK